MQLFSADATMFLKKFKNYFLTLKTLKNNPKKLHTYGSWEFFFLCSPDCPKQPRTSFSFYKFFYPIVSAKVSDAWPLLLHVFSSRFQHEYLITESILIIYTICREQDIKENSSKAIIVRIFCKTTHQIELTCT